MVALLIPWIELLLALCLLSCVVVRKYKWVLFYLVLLAVVNVSSKTFALSIPTERKESGDVKVMTFNIHGTSHKQERDIIAITDMIISETPDIIFLSEDYGCVDNTIDSVLTKTYKYSTKGHPNNGHYFYSKYPIARSRDLSDDELKHSFLYKATICIRDNYINVYGVHLSSKIA